MPFANSQPVSAHPAQPSPATWIAGDELGVSRQRVWQLFKELQPTGAAKRDGSLYLFQRNHPEIAKRFVRELRQRQTSDLSDCTESQRIGAMRRERVIRAARREIPAYMAARTAGRTVAVEWFCTIRVVELSRTTPGGAGELEFPAGVPTPTFRRWESAYAVGGLRALIDRRGGSRGDADEVFTPEAWEHAKALWLDDRRWSAKLCYDLTTVEAERNGWQLPSYRTFCKRLKAIPRAVRVLAREGSRAYDMQCAPRTKRDRSQLAAGDWYCGDEMTHDFYCRAPDGDGGWKRIRPILTAWLCERSRVFVGWVIDDRANTDTILAAFKRALRDWGTPRHVTIDNGHDYTCAAGETKSTKRSAGDRDQVASVFRDLDIEPHFTIPYNPQSKLIESNFRTVHERFDKLWDSFCGGSPDKRPEGATGIPIHQLPTLDEVRARFGEWLEAHHARPHQGDAMFEYSPLQAWEQFQPAVRRERIDDARLDLLCCRYVGPRTVTRDGVSYRGIDYGRGDPAVIELHGRRVWLRLDPERADRVHVCDHATRRHLCTASSRAIQGATQGDVRDAQRAKARRKRAVRAEADTRHVEIDTAVDAVIRAQLARAQSQTTALPPAPPPDAIQIVRPDVNQSPGRKPGDNGSCENQFSHAAQRESLPAGAADDDDADDVYSILAALGDAPQLDDEGHAGDEVDPADFANIPMPAEPEDDADGYAILAEQARRARYGTAG